MVTKIAIGRVVKILCWSVMFGAGGACATPAIVDYVIDGDTFAARLLFDDGIKIKVRVRVADIDTPEINGMCESEKVMANRARDRLGELMPVGTVVELVDITDDKYLGRIDAGVILPDGRNLSRIITDEGLGRSYNGGKRMSWCK